MKTITDINDPAIEPFRTLRDSSAKNQQYIIAESEKVVLKLLKSGITTHKVFATEQFYNEHQEILSDNDIEFLTAPKKVMQQIVGHTLHHGVMALATRPENANLDQLEYPIMIMNGLVSAENVGAIIRNCAAFKVNSILTDSCSPYIRRAIRVSMGNIFAMKVRETDNLLGDIRKLQKNNCSILATANHTKAIDLNNFEVKNNYAVIIGNEGYGIDKEILEASDTILRIPIDGDVAAVNAACASAIFLYALNR